MIGSRVSVAEQKAIFRLWDKGLSHRRIEKIVSASRSTIAGILKRGYVIPPGNKNHKEADSVTNLWSDCTLQRCKECGSNSLIKTGENKCLECQLKERIKNGKVHKRTPPCN